MIDKTFVVLGREIQLSGKHVHPLATSQNSIQDPRIRSEALLEVFQDVRHRTKLAYEKY